MSLPLWFRIVAGSVIIWLLLCSGCQPEASREDKSNPGDIKKIEFMGFTIPVYSTATEQLVYAKSRIADAREKEAALKLVLRRFAQDTYECALARLDLAYLSLGADYRLADQAACRQALTLYHQITRTYANLPGICAKAYWYMGWIHTDLLGDKNNGAAMYQQVINRYASERVTIESPVSWLKLMYPESPEKALTAHDRQHSSWAALALLERVKNDEDSIQRRRALMKLWSQKSAGPATGIALLSALKSGKFNADEAVLRIAREYIQHNFTNKVLARDIETALAQWWPGDIAK